MLAVLNIRNEPQLSHEIASINSTQLISNNSQGRSKAVAREAVA